MASIFRRTRAAIVGALLLLVPAHALAGWAHGHAISVVPSRNSQIVLGLGSYETATMFSNAFKGAGATWLESGGNTVQPTDIDANGYPLPSGNCFNNGNTYCYATVSLPLNYERPGNWATSWAGQGTITLNVNTSGETFVIVSCTGSIVGTTGCNNAGCSSFTGSIAGTTLTVTVQPTGIGCTITQWTPISAAPGAATALSVSQFGAATMVTSAGSPCGPNTCYTVNWSQTVTSESMTLGERMEWESTAQNDTGNTVSQKFEMTASVSGNPIQWIALYHVADSVGDDEQNWATGKISSAIFATRMAQANPATVRDINQTENNQANGNQLPTCSTWEQMKPTAYFSYAAGELRRSLYAAPNGGGTNGADFTASITGSLMTVSAVADGTIYPGAVLTGSGIAAGSTTISSYGTGSGGIGTYNLSGSLTISSESINSSPTVSYDAASDVMTINGFGTGNWQPWETVIVNIPSNLSSGDANLLISLNGNPGVALTSASGGGPGQNNFTNGGGTEPLVYDPVFQEILEIAGIKTSAGGAHGLFCGVPAQAMLELDNEWNVSPWTLAYFIGLDPMTDYIGSYATYVRTNFPQMHPVFETPDEITFNTTYVWYFYSTYRQDFYSTGQTVAGPMPAGAAFARTINAGASNYNSTTGLVTLTLTSPLPAAAPGNLICVQLETGTGSVSSIIGQYPNTGTSSVVTYTIATGETMTIAGATVTNTGWCGINSPVNWVGKIFSTISQAVANAYGGDYTRFDVVAGAQTCCEGTNFKNILLATPYTQQNTNVFPIQAGYTNDPGYRWGTQIGNTNYWDPSKNNGMPGYQSQGEIALAWCYYYQGAGCASPSSLISTYLAAQNITQCCDGGSLSLAASIAAWANAANTCFGASDCASYHMRGVRMYEGGYSIALVSADLTVPVTGVTTGSSCNFQTSAGNGAAAGMSIVLTVGGGGANWQSAGSATTSATPTTSPTLTFSTNFTPPIVRNGFFVYDLTNPGSITAGTTVSSYTPVAVTMSANPAAAVNSGDEILFTTAASNPLLTVQSGYTTTTVPTSLNCSGFAGSTNGTSTASTVTALTSAAQIAAGGSWTTANQTITMGVPNPGWVVPGLPVYDVTTSSNLGTVLTYSGATLTLTAVAKSGSAGAGDTLQFGYSVFTVGGTVTGSFGAGQVISASSYVLTGDGNDSGVCNGVPCTGTGGAGTYATNTQTGTQASEAINSSSTLTYYGSGTFPGYVNYFRTESYFSPDFDTGPSWATQSFLAVTTNGAVQPSQYEFDGPTGSWFLFSEDMYGFTQIATCSACIGNGTTLTLGGNISGVFSPGNTVVNVDIPPGDTIASGTGRNAGDTVQLTQPVTTAFSGTKVAGKITPKLDCAGQATDSAVTAWLAYRSWNNNLCGAP